MKKFNWKATLATVCASAMVVGFVPAAASAMDTSYFDQMNAIQQQYQAALQAQMEAQQEAGEDWLEALTFDVKAAYRHLMSLKTPAEQEKYFFSLNIYQRAKLVEYLQYKASIGEFTGFDEPDFALQKEIEAERKAMEERRAEEERRANDPEYAAQKQFEEDYANQIDLYRKYGDFADLSSVPAEVADQIKDFVAEEKAAEAEAAEEKDASASEDAAPDAEATSGEETTAPAEGTSTEETTAPAEETTSPAEGTTEEPSAPADDAPAAEPAAPELTEEEKFALDYASYIDMYEKYGTAANYDGISYDAYQKIQAMFPAPVVEEPAESEEPAADETVIDEETDETAPASDETAETTEPAVDETVESTEPASEETTEATEPAADAADEDTATDEEVPAAEGESEAEEPSDEESEPAAEGESEVAEDASSETEDTSAEVEAPAEEPVAEAPAIAPVAPATVTLTTSRTDTMTLGDPVTLTGILEGADEYNDVIYVWEVDKGNGVFETVPDATGPSYTFYASVETLRWNWRLSVLYR